MLIRVFWRRESRRSFSCKRRNASSLFLDWDLYSVAITAIPVGMWVSLTADSVLFFFWPPGPLDLYVSTLTSLASDLRSVLYALGAVSPSVCS